MMTRSLWVIVSNSSFRSVLIIGLNMSVRLEQNELIRLILTLVGGVFLESLSVSVSPEEKDTTQYPDLTAEDRDKAINLFLRAREECKTSGFALVGKEPGKTESSRISSFSRLLQQVEKKFGRQIFG